MTDFAEIYLTRGYIAVIDAEDLERVTAYTDNWQALVLKNGLVYAKTDKRYGPRRLNMRRCTYLHVLVMDRINATDGLEVHHSNGNGLHCWKANLHVVTHAQNQQNRRGLQTNNTSGVNGIYWNIQKQKWCAEIHFNGHKYHLGLHNTIEAATAARAQKEQELCLRIR